MRQFLSITKRELISYFATPVAYVFITIFLLLSGLFTFYLGNFFEIGQASLGSFLNGILGFTCFWYLQLL